MISFEPPSCRSEPCPSPGTSGFERPGAVLRGTSQRMQGRREAHGARVGQPALLVRRKA